MRYFVLVRDSFLTSLLCLAILAGKGVLSWWYLLIPTGLYMAIMVLGATIIRLNFFIPSLHHGDRRSNRIALTFDDGPTTHTEEILDILKREDVPAAFFSIGKRAAAAPEIVKRWQQEGHLIGNHSYGHSFHFDWQDRNAMEEEILHTNETIYKITGMRPLLFRPPYGVTNPELAHAVNLSGMTSIGWSLRSYDTQARNPQRLLERITSKVRGGDIILMHDSAPITPGILTALIHSCREKGFTFVRLDKMLDIDAYA